MTKGDIVLIPFPFTDLTGNKNRPALILVVSENDITVAFITSQTKWEEEFDIELIPTKTNGIKKKSLVRLSKIATIDKELAIGKLGNLTSKEIVKVNRNLVSIFKIEK